MDYENGLDLGLGLSCGNSSSKTAKKDADALLTQADNGDKVNVAAGFKNFNEAASLEQDAGVDNQQDGRAESQGCFFENLSKVENKKSTNGHDEGEVSYTTNKRKTFLDEMNHIRRQESDHTGPLEKKKISHISITTDDGSTEETEDVADSEIECSTSMPISNSVTICKDAVEAEGTKNMICNAPYVVQPVSTMETPGYPQILPLANGERPPISLKSPMAFGYSPVQFPILTRDHTWGTVTRPQQSFPSNMGRVFDNAGIRLEMNKWNAEISSELVSGMVPPPGLYEASKESESKLVRDHDGIRKVAGVAEGSNRTTINFKERAESDQLTLGFSHVASAIKPGIAANIKFGGSGSCPALPWVSTIGPGPNGRTISGVTYRFSPNQIKIVCACHGSHMTPEEFVRHASDEYANQNGSTCIGLFPNKNPAASAQS